MDLNCSGNYSVSDNDLDLNGCKCRNQSICELIQIVLVTTLCQIRSEFHSRYVKGMCANVY